MSASELNETKRLEKVGAGLFCCVIPFLSPVAFVCVWRRGAPEIAVNCDSSSSYCSSVLIRRRRRRLLPLVTVCVRAEIAGEETAKAKGKVLKKQLQ